MRHHTICRNIITHRSLNALVATLQAELTVTLLGTPIFATKCITLDQNERLHTMGTLTSARL